MRACKHMVADHGPRQGANGASSLCAHLYKLVPPRPQACVHGTGPARGPPLDARRHSVNSRRSSPLTNMTYSEGPSLDWPYSRSTKTMGTSSIE